MKFEVIGHVHTVYPEKFGVPRQSGIIDAPGYITFEPPYDDANAFRGLEEYDRVWLIWLASENMKSDGGWNWHPTVRPPRLGGNARKGVYATRSPYHPNGIGLSCVRLTAVHPDGSDWGVSGPVVEISGMDLVDGTPLIDMKPYVPYADSFPEASCSFATPPTDDILQVILPDELKAELEASSFDSGDLDIILEMISKDPRPRYQDVSERVYGMSYRSYNVRFVIDHGVATVLEIKEK